MAVVGPTDNFQTAIDDAGLSQVATLAPVAHDLVKLESSIRDLGDSFEGTAVAFSIDVENNVIHALVEDPDGFELEAASRGVSLPAWLEVDRVAGLGGLTTDVYGGLAIGGGCTSGFSVKNVTTGAKGVTSAGHCSDSTSYAGTTMPFQSQAFGGSSDIQWNYAPTPLTVRNYAYDGIPPLGYRTITSKLGRSGMAQNAYVCKYGRVTSYDCGYVVTTSFDPPDTAAWGPIPNDNATYIEVNDPYGADLANTGDSGGPWYKDHVAWGTTVGQCCGFNDNDSPVGIFMASNYLEGPIGVTILFQ